MMRIPNAEVVALCDLVPEKVSRVQEWFRSADLPVPTGYSGSHEEYIRMIGEEDLDLVYTVTPWQYHAPICLEAMRNGANAATEIPMGIYLDELWEMVETAERTGRHCIMMENCCYDRMELMILNMVRQGLFGDLLHAECGYLHDLRALKTSPTYYEERWRIYHSIARDADLYPCHGLGPIAQCMNINRGNQFDFLVSMSCNSGGIGAFAAAEYGPDHEWANQEYALGDVQNTLIRTVGGQTIIVTHDTNTPRPYSRKVLVQGTKGLVRKYPEQKIYVEGVSRPHQWEDLSDAETRDRWYAEWEHPLHTAIRESASGAGHGGMDYIEDYRLIQCLHEGTPMDMDVYDGAAWSAVVELSERSIARRSRSVDFPDFTRGAWREREPLGIIDRI
jgi:predicted dehydrogenase